MPQYRMHTFTHEQVPHHSHSQGHTKRQGTLNFSETGFPKSDKIGEASEQEEALPEGTKRPTNTSVKRPNSARG